MTETEVAVACADLDANVEFFTSRLGFRIESVFPADDPRTVVIAGAGVRLRLERSTMNCSGVRLEISNGVVAAGDEAGPLVAPNGMRIVAARAATRRIPSGQQRFELCRRGDSEWISGRAGMQYRDLLPSRQGGRFIVSQIRIQDGGVVDDYVHFHRVRYQAIYCRRGWVEVVYEDQGPPFVMHPGDCVLQPPEIRHRVLRCSDGLEVIEIACPASHETHADHELSLPTSRVDGARDFSNQRFTYHDASESAWKPWTFEGLECQESGIGEATRGLAGLRVLRPRRDSSAGITPGINVPMHAFDAELYFTFVLEGTTELCRDGRSESLEAGDCFAIPARTAIGLTNCSHDLRLLEMTLPAALERHVVGSPQSAG